ncbi:MAG: imidazole glycerol phosphate synthase subunit HisH [Acidobacteria bacterium]|nr:imidazole glycerol phosphate synthase subunit HisH [Acidobacteriota bacterium]MBV9071213.1 imidazole glycerol phosphate synthase subunit HisH [Acidobacteriota bacterium]MBV9187086.1 imidazole glycerol phosphate synthase subunit HisH [Acidobacteriota bacterium]
MKVSLIDSPVANVANIARALRTAGAEVEITSDPIAIANAQKLVLPGVGSFIAAMQWLTENGIDHAIRDAVKRGASLLGVCVGHQLLFDLSHEMGSTPGLGLVKGEVHKFGGILPVPQIGWNRVAANGPLFDGVENGVFYFVNSYAAMNAPDEIARADYGGPFTAAVQRERVFGVQFHPEKSSAAGLRVLRNFIAWM